MRAIIPATLIVLLLAVTPHAGAAPGPATLPYVDVLRSLTLSASGIGDGVLVNLAIMASLPPLDRAEVENFQQALADPLSLIELPRVPPALLDSIVLYRVGNVIGPHVGQVPSDQLTNVNALDNGAGVISSDLLGTHNVGTIRGELPQQEIEDLNAMIGTSSSTW